MTLLTLKCNCCGWNHRIKKDSKAPEDAVMMQCNYCLQCNPDLKGIYNEWYVNEKGEKI